jgi:hypothetical protein
LVYEIGTAISATVNGVPIIQVVQVSGSVLMHCHFSYKKTKKREIREREGMENRKKEGNHLVKMRMLMNQLSYHEVSRINLASFITCLQRE